MADPLPAHYGPDNEYYYKENGQWYQKSSFFVNSFLKRSEDQVPKEYLQAELKLEKRLSMPSTSSKAESAGLSSIVSKGNSAVKKSCVKDGTDLGDKQQKLQSRMDAQKQIMNLNEEDSNKQERVNTANLSSKKRLSIFDDRSKNRGTECENRPETQELVLSKNKNRAVRGRLEYCSAADHNFDLSEENFFHIEDLMEFAASKNVTVINAYQFLTVNTSRSTYFDANGCVYCVEHGSLVAHSPEVRCPHIECACVRCFALDLVKPDSS
uniref:Uncharacterized protein n=1 Tax=Ditylenchus dipsaci TaxID=166011 RepID=A0A915DHA0_9BILA